ncbi:hypothetical protein BU23DRAFT_10260 [Bimuria novae-zelandiae CBS 107.79]|uniref:Uncharacterized protein n=1 Tax=Bimuria novae-zelandiae CBS 107.79 TaxID=1447943 RepID=A0A6A5VT15_9PLEO|nr:hypothetical protein BU23DRAFT_10260 [Bimuria novae-zelandiae CBS 107.79]
MRLCSYNSRYIFATYGPGINFTLTIPRVLNDDHPSFQYLADDNTDGLKHLFAKGEISPRDIDGNGESLLHLGLRSTLPWEYHSVELLDAATLVAFENEAANVPELAMLSIRHCAIQGE